MLKHGAAGHLDRSVNKNNPYAQYRCVQHQSVNTYIKDQQIDPENCELSVFLQTLHLYLDHVTWQGTADHTDFIDAPGFVPVITIT